MAARPNRNRPSRMTRVPVTAVGSGARVMDLFPLPMPLFIIGRMIRSLFRHWYLALIALTFVFFDWRFITLAIVTMPLVLFCYMWYHNRRHSPSAIAHASYRFLRARMKWRRACEAADLVDGPRTPHLTSPRRHPKIANLRGTALEFTIDLARVSLTVRDLEENKDYIAATLGARRTRLHRLTPGTCRFVIEWERKLSKSAVANPADQIHSTQLPRIELDQDVLLELDTSLLVVGESGSGKSNLTWFMLNEMNANFIPYRLYVIDPKKVELAELVDSPYTVRYSDSPTTADPVIEAFYDAMMDTFEHKMKPHHLRRMPISSENPLHILVIDELLLTRQAKQGIDTHLGEILSAGRAAGFIVIANSQLGQVDAISRLRDLFPQRICMATNSVDLTSAVLGPRAEERGARCTEITEKGVGYIFTDFTGTFQRFKPPLVTDVQTVANGNVWHPPTSPTSLERWRQRNWKKYGNNKKTG